jgi:hypothetical protein
MRDGRDPTERPEDGVDRAADRVRALADEPLPTEVRDRHLLRIRAHAVAADRAPAAPVRGRRWRRRLAPLTAAATALVLFGGGGTVVAAQDATPDDALYGVKRVSEQLWVGLPRGREGAAEVHLALAERRLHEAQRSPRHAQRLVAEGVESAEAAADERPAEAVESLGRLLGDGEGRLPEQASPRAREALHRNCARIAAKHGLSDAPCGAAPDASEHPGRRPRSDSGRGAGREGAPGQQGREGAPGQQDGDRPARGMEGREHPGRGWGPGGRPDGAVGPPPGASADPDPARGRRANRG